MKYFLALIITFSFAAFAQNTTPTTEYNQTMVFEDDLDFANMLLAIDRQLESFRRAPQRTTVKYGRKTYPAKSLEETMVSFRELVVETQECFKRAQKEFCMNEFNARVNVEYDIYVPVPASTEPGFGQKQTTLYTGYYSPDLQGSLTPTARYKNPVYGMTSRADQRSLTREQIDFEGALAGQGLELFYVEDSLFDIYLFHVEGGGRVTLHNEDGSVYGKSYLSYAGANGQRFAFLFRIMLERGWLKEGETSIANQRKFIEENPQHAREIFASSPSYIFFKKTQDEPLGVRNIPLTENRSLAIDVRTYKDVGVINYIKANRPRFAQDGSVERVNFSRFFISQDTGGAIRGNARVDLYLGFGPEAALGANSMKGQGEQYFLIKK